MTTINKVMAGLLTVSTAGLLFIATHEGTVSTAYRDSAGIPTICTGHTKGVKMGQKATRTQCEQFLMDDLADAEKSVQGCTHVPVTQEQFDVLVSFTFNVGGNAYCNSTLAKKLNAGDCKGAASEFSRWNRAGGRVIQGLKNRREDEREVFLRGCV